MKQKQGPILVVFSLAVTAFFVGYFVKHIDFPALKEQLKAARYIFLLPAALSGLLVYVVKTFRWRVIMKPLFAPSLRHLFASILIGFMGNCVLPARLGELLRPGVLRLRDRRVSFTAAFATIVVERLFDLFVVVFYMTLGLFWLSRQAKAGANPEAARYLATIREVAGFSGLVAVAMVLSIIALRLLPEWTRRVAHGVTQAMWRLLGAALGALILPMRWLRAATYERTQIRLRSAFARGEEMIEHLLNGFIDGLSVIRTPGQGLWILVLSLIHWSFCIGMYYFAGLCFPSLAWGWGGATLVFAFTAFAVAAPQAPGFVGTFQFAVNAAVLLATGAQHDGYAIVAWLVAIVPVTIAGLICLWAEGLSLGQIRNQTQPAEGDSEKLKVKSEK